MGYKERVTTKMIHVTVTVFMPNGTLRLDDREQASRVECCDAVGVDPNIIVMVTLLGWIDLLSVPDLK